jgi:hypothetical protein
LFEGEEMSDVDFNLSAGSIDKDTADALVGQLRNFPKPSKELEQGILDALVHILTDPIERLKLGPSGHFSEDEEVILRSLEGQASNVL